MRLINFLIFASLLWAATPYANGAESNTSSTPKPSGETRLETISLKRQDTAARSQPHQDDIPNLESIVVTATKRPTARDNVPLSIGYLSGAALEDMGAMESRDFLTKVPGVQQSEVYPEFHRISIRGVQTDTAAVTPAATGYFVDDIPFTGPFVLHARPDLPPFDLEAVELLKGPQGTLYGASALGGAIRYRVNDAKVGTWESRGFFQHQAPTDGSPNHSLGIAVNAPIAENVGIRVVGIGRMVGGRIDDKRNGIRDTDKSQRYSGRALLRWTPSTPWSFGLKIFAQSSRADDVPFAETVDGTFERERALRKAPLRSRSTFGSFEGQYRFRWAELKSITSMTDRYAYVSGKDGARALGIEDTGQTAAVPTTEDIQGFVQELRLASPPAVSPWRWLAGIYAHQYSEISTQQIFTTEENTQIDLTLLNFRADITALEQSIFGEITRELGEKWSVTAGMRAYKVKTSGLVTSSGALILATGNLENQNDADVTASGINPKLAIQFSATDKFKSYLSVSRGFRFGGIQTIGPSLTAPDVPQTYKPDTVWNYEWGLRTQWLNERLRLNGAVFYIDWKDPQLQTTTGGAVPLNIIDNIGHARSQGAELELAYRPPFPGLQMNLAAAWTDARTTETYTTPDGTDAEAGARLPGSAQNQLVAAIGYAWSRGQSQFNWNLSHNRQGPGVNDILGTMSIYDYEVTDTRIRISNPRWLKNAAITIGLNNIFDNRAVIQATVTSETDFTTVYNNSRTLFSRIDWRW